MAEFSNLNGYDVKDKKAIRTFDTVADMKADANLKAGQCVATLGYYSANDGGGALYYIESVQDSDDVDEMCIIKITDSIVAKLLLEDSMNNKQLGILGDGVDDVADKLNVFFGLDIKNYYLIDGEYLIDGDINLTSNSRIYFNNATIKRKETTKSTYFMLNIGHCDKVFIYGAHLIGDRDTHTGTEGEWGYGIHIWGSTNIIVKDSIIEKTWGDGIYIGYSYSDSNPLPCYNITIDNCRVLSCSRNAFALGAGKNIKILNCYAYGTNRVNPKAGIDIESEAPSGNTLILDDIYVENFKTENNNYGVVVRINNDFNDIVIDNHLSLNEWVGFVSYGINNKGNMLYENANIIKSKNNAINITKKNNNTLILRNIIIDSRTLSGDTHNYMGAIHINTTSSDSGNIIIDNVKAIKTFTDLYDYQDIICETGTGTLTGLNLYNIETNKYLCLNNAGSTGVNLNNCKFYNISIGATINLDKRTIYNLINIYRPLGDTTYRNVKNTLPDGTYEIQLSNNTVPFFMYVVFDSECTVYTAGNQAAVSNSHRTSTKGGYMKFIKYGNIITILQTTFTPYTAS